MHYLAIPCNTIQYHLILCNTMQYHPSFCSVCCGLHQGGPKWPVIWGRSRRWRNQRKIRRQQRRDKEKGNIKMKNTPSREANTVFVNKTQNKPKITNEDSIAKKNMNDTLYQGKSEKRRRGKKGRRAKFSPSLLSTISSAGQQLALGQLNIR